MVEAATTASSESAGNAELQGNIPTAPYFTRITAKMFQEDETKEDFFKKDVDSRNRRGSSISPTPLKRGGRDSAMSDCDQDNGSDDNGSDDANADN